MRWLILVFMCATFANANDLDSAPMSKEAKLKALRQAMRSTDETAVVKKKNKLAQPEAEVDFRQTALRELAEQSVAKSRAPASVPTPTTTPNAKGSQLATVQTSQLFSEDPRVFRGLQVGLTVQPFQAAGTINLVGVGQRDLAQLPTAPMFGLELKYTAELFSLRALANYSSQPVRWRGQTGRDLGNTRLNALQTGVLVGRERRFTNWNLLGDVGLARFDFVQTGDSNLTEISGGRWLALARVGAAYPLGPTWVSLSYERRIPVSSSWVDVDANSWLLGVHYGLR